MGIRVTTTRVVAASWPLKGAKPTVKEIIAMAKDLEDSNVPGNTTVEFEPPHSDAYSFPARFFIRPFEIKG